ncbi:MAG: hypothetical protein E7365_00375 [Clostridiales bacterium]|nr:hypothetical protein [Clostridiales bacterium]
MIKIERTDVMNFENAIRGARNPLNSWDRCDSNYDNDGNYILGDNDLNLAVRLANAGTDHRKFMRMIFVSVDITAPLYWWKEFDTYKVGTVANSCSTMHKIHSKELTREDFSFDKLNAESLKYMDNLLVYIEDIRQKYLQTKDKELWYNLIQLLPSSFNQMRTITMNYENLRSMYHARKSHKLDEWHVYCDWIKSLPYAKELIIGEENE